jgi:DegV family protein with EDD domain
LQGKKPFMIQIITDSTADLETNLAARHSISVIPLSVIIGGQSYKDGLELSPTRLFELIEQNGVLPTTAAPSVGEYHQLFNQPGESIYIGISSKLSASVANARLAARELPPGKVRVIDSHSVCVGTGSLVLAAAELRDNGCSAEEIERKLGERVPRSRMLFVVNTLEYLHKGGRCSAVQALLGSLLKIHPIIQAQPDGTLGVKEKIRGSRRKILNTLLDNFKQDLPQIDLHRVFVAHAGALEEAEQLCTEIRQLADPEDLQIAEAGCVISSHCGPGTLALQYVLE